jgi:hypothetical protein
MPSEMIDPGCAHKINILIQYNFVIFLYNTKLYYSILLLFSVMIDRIIIITTAISRMDMHNVTFPAYKKFVGNSYDVKWFINIDTPSYCKDDPNDTENNLRNMLSKYDVFIYRTKIPNFFNAAKSLLVASEKYLTDNCCVLWLEDDWIVNRISTIKYFVDNFVKPYSVISLVYNMLGSFPPFIMGPSIAKIFYDKYIVLNSPKKNPETVSRKIFRIEASKIGIVYYSYIENIDTLKKVKNYVHSGLIYRESYLKIEDCRILCNNSKETFDKLGSITLPVEDLCDYRGEMCPCNKIIFIRFGIRDDNIMYKNSFFKDLGRQWKKNISQNK